MKTSRSVISLILILIVSSFYSQTDSLAPSPADVRSTPRFELGLNIYGFNIRAGDYYTQYKNVWDNQVFSGLYVKRYKGKMAMRGSIEYSRRNAYFGEQPLSRFAAIKGQLASLELKFGYQRLLSSKKIAPYVFTDLEYTHFFQVSFPYPEYYYARTLPFYYTSNRFYTLRGSFISLSPGIGIRWSVAKTIFINIESSAQIFLSRERTVKNNDVVHSVGLNARPLKLSLGFAF